MFSDSESELQDEHWINGQEQFFQNLKLRRNESHGFANTDQQIVRQSSDVIIF